MTKPKLSIIMPVRNEGANLRIILKIIPAIVDTPHEILVVYDSLDDNGIPAIKELNKDNPSIKPVHNKMGSGVINAIKSGVNAASGDYVLIMAADDIGPVLIIEQMISLMEKGYDFISATRYAHGGKNIGGVFASRALSKIANALFHMLTGSQFTDSTLGVKMLRRSIFNKLALEAKPIGWAVAFEMSIKAQLLGLRLNELPVISINRFCGFYGGKSSFRLNWIFEYLKWFFWGLKKLNSGKIKNQFN